MIQTSLILILSLAAAAQGALAADAPKAPEATAAAEAAKASEAANPVKAATVGDPKAPTALPAALAKAYADGARDITIASGTYVMPISGSSSIFLDSWKDTTLHADGVTIIAEDVTQRPVQLRKCERVTFEGALIRYVSPSFTQGRIVAIRKKGKETSVDWRIDKGYEVPKDDKLPSLDVADQKTRLLRVGTGDFHCAKIERIEPGLLRLHGVTDIGTAQEGDWIFTRISRGGLVTAAECTGCTFRKITLQNAGFAAFFEGGGGSNRFLECRVMPGPRPPGATEDQLVGCGADGFHSTGTSVGPHIEGCSWEGLLHDDCIAIHGSFQTVAGSEGNKLLLEAGRRGGFVVGDPVRISDTEGYHAEFICTGLRDIRKKVEYVEYKLVVRGETVPITLTVRMGSAPEYTDNETVRLTNGKGVTTEFRCKGIRKMVREEEFAELTLNGESGAKAGARASNPKHNGAGYKIINCKMGNCRSRGILVKSDNGLIEGNTISGCGMSAISIGPEFGWGEADYCRKVVVRGNKLSGNVANAGGCGVVLVHGDGAIGNREISIVDNVFEGNHSRSEIRMEWTDGATISGNRFTFPQGQPQADAILSLAQARKITLNNNLLIDPAPGLTPVKSGPEVKEVDEKAGFKTLLSPAPVTQPLSAAAKAPHQFNPEAAKRLLEQGIDKLVFVRRFTLTCSHIYTEFIDARWTPGGGLCVLDLKSGAVTDLLPEMGAKGVFNRFDLSYDAKKIVFDYKKSAQEGYRIYEVDIDGKNLRQLTFPGPEEKELLKRHGRETDDMHPCYLPNGDVVFTSTRSQYSVLCSWSFKSPVLHRMDANGKNLRQLSFNCLSEFSPAVLPDGRILYMRWEYNRKGAGAVKCLWSMRPDGTQSAEVYGDNIVDPETMIYGRPVPGTPDKISFLGCSHWGPNNGAGAVMLLDTKVDAQSREAMTRITPEIDARTHAGFSFLVDGKWVDEATGTLGRLFKDPYPLSEKLFLVAQKPKGRYWHDPKGYDLSLLDAQGKETLLYRDEEISCWHPYPLLPRVKPPMLPSEPAQPELAKKKLAQCLVADVYQGLTGVPRGTVKYLRIMEQTPAPWSAKQKWRGDGEGMASSTLGYGILGMQAQHGIVPVEEDGSANFYVPADRNIYLQALDEGYRSVQIERTYVNYKPGEVRSCVGCHNRAGTPTNSAGMGKAFRREPSQPGPQPGENSGQKLFDYARQIQPIWDKQCVSCHNGTPETKARLDLTGELTERYNRSYQSLLGRPVDASRMPSGVLAGSQVDENAVRAFIELTPPYFFGANTSLLLAAFDSFTPHLGRYDAKTAEAMLKQLQTLREQHKSVKLSREELVRIANWLDASCQYYNSYWGMKNIALRQSPYFRPQVSFQEAIGSRVPESLRGAYEDTGK